MLTFEYFRAIFSGANIWEVKGLDLQISIGDRPNLFTQATEQMIERELAIGLNQEPVWVTQSITPYACKALIRRLNQCFQVLQVWCSKCLLGISVEPIRLIEFKDRRVLVQAITPITSPTQQPASVALPAKHVQPDPKVPLVVYINTSKFDQQIVGRALAHFGYQFIPIQNPVQALPCLLEYRPELIFLDLRLPIVNGYELCSQIRRISIFSDTPIIILTHCDNFVDRVRAKVVGSTSFLAKPMGFEKVQAILQQHLSAQNCFP